MMGASPSIARRAGMFFGRIPLYLLTLPVFFVGHAYTEYYNLVAASDAWKLTGLYALGGLGMAALSWLFFRDRDKAGLYAFYLLCVFFFFGALMDGLKKLVPGSFVTRYSFLLPLLLVVSVLLWIVLRRSRSGFFRLNLYLNLLLLVLIAFDGLQLMQKVRQRRTLMLEHPLATLTDMKHPPMQDIYLIVADGYAGLPYLRKQYGYGNDSFVHSLQRRGFVVAESSRSNYDFTVFSIGSLLNLDYLDVKGKFEGQTDLPVAFSAVRHNLLTSFLERNGYRFHNHSMFDISGHPAPLEKTLMRFEKNIVTSRTFFSLLKKDIGFHLITRLGLSPKKEELSHFRDLDNTLLADSLTRKTAREAVNNGPKFVYAHLMMPHWPYYYDSTGTHRVKDRESSPLQSDKNAYLSYLKYSNTRLLDLVDDILRHSTRPPVILLISDHGYREENFRSAPDEYPFSNWVSVLLPGRDSLALYPGITNVNVMRLFVNKLFQQRLPLLRDSTIAITQ